MADDPQDEPSDVSPPPPGRRRWPRRIGAALLCIPLLVLGFLFFGLRHQKLAPTPRAPEPARQPPASEHAVSESERAIEWKARCVYRHAASQIGSPVAGGTPNAGRVSRGTTDQSSRPSLFTEREQARGEPGPAAQAEQVAERHRQQERREAHFSLAEPTARGATTSFLSRTFRILGIDRFGSNFVVRNKDLGAVTRTPWQQCWRTRRSRRSRRSPGKAQRAWALHFLMQRRGAVER